MHVYIAYMLRIHLHSLFPRLFYLKLLLLLDYMVWYSACCKEHMRLKELRNLRP